MTDIEKNETLPWFRICLSKILRGKSPEPNQLSGGGGEGRVDWIRIHPFKIIKGEQLEPIRFTGGGGGAGGISGSSATLAPLQKPYPRQEEPWRHVETGYVVTVKWLHLFFVGYKKGETAWFYDFELVAKSDISPWAQCVVFKGSDGRKYVRTVENFLDRFERVG